MGYSPPDSESSSEPGPSSSLASSSSSNSESSLSLPSEYPSEPDASNSDSSSSSSSSSASESRAKKLHPPLVKNSWGSATTVFIMVGQFKLRGPSEKGIFEESNHSLTPSNDSIGMVLMSVTGRVKSL